MDTKCLGALDVNANINREQATAKEGALRCKVKVDRAGEKFSVQPVRQEKCNQWKLDIIDLVKEYLAYV